MDIYTKCVIKFTLDKDDFTKSNLLLIEGAYVRWAQRFIRLNHDLSAVMLTLAFSGLEMYPVDDNHIQCYSQFFETLTFLKPPRGSKDYFVDFKSHSIGLTLNSKKVNLILNFGTEPSLQMASMIIPQLWGKRGSKMMVHQKEWQMQTKCETYRFGYLFTYGRDPVVPN